MDEAQNLADRLAVIDRGKIVAEGTPDTIGGRRSAGTTIRFDARGLPVDAIPLNHVAVAEGIVEVSTENPTRDLHALTAWAVSGGHTPEDLTVTRPSLEDVYLELTDEGTEG